MKRGTLLICFLMLASSYTTYSQLNNYFTVEAELSTPPISKRYFYNTNTYEINNVSLDKTEHGLDITYGINFSYNFLIFNQFSVGGLFGFNNDNQQFYSHIRLGVKTKYYFVKEKYHNFNLQLAENFSLHKNKFKSGVNLRLGVELPVLNLKNNTILTNFYWEQNYYKLDGSDKLLNLSDEIPRSLTKHLFGISIGIVF